jgi:diguanylate cyclase (GGDEF)-like protein
MIPNGAITVSSRRVLVVEQNAADRQLLRNWLASEMIEVYEAVDIITALAACQKYQPNLVLLQLRLNTWDGYEVIRRLKDDPKTRSIPVIFVAASALTQEKAKGIDMGAVDFVSKPFDSVELLARVNSALRTKALLDLLEQRAHLDGLTELGNRFALQDALPLEFAANRQKGAPLSVVIADIDHFKRINDHYGHAAGDEVLRRMAMVLRGAVRPNDFLARYGGEEFVVLCPDCAIEAALETAERVRVGVAGLRVTFRNSVIQMTSSVGVNCVRDPYPADPQEALDRADQALYRAKSAGRNAVWYHDPALGKPAPASAFVPGPGHAPEPVAAAG